MQYSTSRWPPFHFFFENHPFFFTTGPADDDLTAADAFASLMYLADTDSSLSYQPRMDEPRNLLMTHDGTQPLASFFRIKGIESAFRNDRHGWQSKKKQRKGRRESEHAELYSTI